MRRLACIAITATFVFCSSAWAGEKSPTSDYKHFEEFGEIVIGRWTGEATLTDDLEGVGKAGDEVGGHAVTRWILDRKAVECQWTLGTVAGKWIAVWNPVKEQIVMYSVDSNGAISEAVVSKEKGKWVERYSGVSSDGNRMSGTSIMKTADDGKVITYDETERVEDAKPLPDFRHTLKRLSR